MFPEVVSYSPADALEINYSNTPIVIKFNSAMEPSQEDLKLFNYNNISITYNGSNYADFFEDPVFDIQSKSLTLNPKIPDFYDELKKLNLSFVELQVSLSDKIAVTKEENLLPLLQNDKTVFSVRYKTEIEEVAPVKYDFYAVSDLKYENFTDKDKFSLDLLSDFENEKILLNRTRSIVHIFGRYYDADSGVKTVTVTEKHTNTKDAKPVDGEAVQIQYTSTSENTIFTASGGYTEFYIPYTLLSDDGAVLLTVTVLDACGNFDENESVSFTAIKDSYIDLSELNVENTPENLTSIWFTQTGHPYINDNNSFQWTNLKKVVYGSCVISGEYLKVECLYTDDSGIYHEEEFGFDPEYTFVWTSNQGDHTYTHPGWSLTLQNIQDVSNKRFIVRVTDDIGNVSTKDFMFPPEPVFMWAKTIYSSEGYIDVEFSHTLFENKAESDFCFIHVKQNSDNYVYSKDTLPAIWIKENEECIAYHSISKRRDSRGLYGKQCQEFSTAQTQDFALDEVEHTNITYKKSSESGYVDVTITVALDSWEKYDSIFAQYSKDVYFEKESLSCTLKIPVKSLINNNATILLGAQKNGISAPTKKIILEEIDPVKFDNVPPGFPDFGGTYNFNYLTAINTHFDKSPYLNDYLMFSSMVSDEYSGLSYCILKNNATGGRVLIPIDELHYDSEKKYLFYPKWDLDTDVTHTLYAYDKQNNVGEQKDSRDFFINNLPKITRFDSFKLETETADRTYYLWRYYIYKYNTEDDEWEYLTKKDYNTNMYGTTRINAFFDSGMVVDGNFYKAVYQLASSTYAITFDSSIPRYYYKGQQNTGIYDYLLPNGNSKESVVISSDAPVFVQTLVTKYPYEECKNWDSYKWQRNRRHIGEKVLDFAEDSRAKKYAVPLSEIDSGDCYVVIAHFADGSTAMSEVMQK